MEQCWTDYLQSWFYRFDQEILNIFKTIKFFMHQRPPSGDMHVVVNSVIIGSGNGLAPNRHQAITWTNVVQDNWWYMTS